MRTFHHFEQAHKPVKVIHNTSENIFIASGKLTWPTKNDDATLNSDYKKKVQNKF